MGNLVILFSASAPVATTEGSYLEIVLATY